MQRIEPKESKGNELINLQTIATDERFVEGV
jgi:hypothetical protein